LAVPANLASTATVVSRLAVKRYVMRSKSRLDGLLTPLACQSSQATASIEGVRTIKIPSKKGCMRFPRLQTISAKLIFGKDTLTLMNLRQIFYLVEKSQFW
jgi:hypothetical protein